MNIPCSARIKTDTVENGVIFRGYCLFCHGGWVRQELRLNVLITQPLSERFKGQEHSQLKKRINRSKVSSLMNILVTFETNRVLSSDNIHNKE